jgi:hypothetical protein
LRGCGGGVAFRCDGRLKARPTSGFVLGRKDGREPAGAEIREQFDEGVEDAEQHQADPRPEHPHDHALIAPRRDRLAHVIQDDRQIGIGVKRDGVGQGGSCGMNDRDTM